MESLISQYIDNELSILEKKDFVQKVHQDRDYLDETVSLLDQEQQLRSILCHQMAEAAPVTTKRKFQWRQFLFTGGQTVAALLVATLAFTAGSLFFRSDKMIDPDRDQFC
jgi:hypothetical protein